jgi:hypothetical protein
MKNTTGITETTLGIHEGSPGGSNVENRTAILLTDVNKRTPLENIFPVNLPLELLRLQIPKQNILLIF